MRAFFEARNVKELCKILRVSESQAAKVGMRRDLVMAIRNRIRRNGWTHLQSAKKANMGRTVITAIMNGDIQSISTDRLIDIAYRLGLTLQLKVA